MANPLPRWLFKKYAKMWVQFGDKDIQYPQLQEFFYDTSIGTALTKMVRCGWIVRPARARYKLNSPEYMVKEVSKL